ncbi:hypothetical protein D3C87_1411540 [compost metagenome]
MMRADFKTTILQFSKAHLHFVEMFFAVQLALVTHGVHISHVRYQEWVVIQHRADLINLRHEMFLASFIVFRIELRFFFSERRRQDEAKIRMFNLEFLKSRVKT